MVTIGTEIPSLPMSVTTFRFTFHGVRTISPVLELAELSSWAFAALASGISSLTWTRSCPASTSAASWARSARARTPCISETVVLSSA